MAVQLHLPSIPDIRAKLIIKKLGSSFHDSGFINLFITGRTGSGKTTLGNRLLGVDYFLSTGHQDCTREVNLIEFPIGIKYFDLPGVCSDDELENFNRLSLGIKQIEDFPTVKNITIAKFCEGKTPEQLNLSADAFANNSSFKPDLILYLIAPDKQFTKDDRKYLRDLLKSHHQVIYVFNIFANKDIGKSFAATKANFIDATTKITEVHTSILGKNSTPNIVAVNCWTGEGIADLLSQCQITLNSVQGTSFTILNQMKGKAFEELVQYQQEQTPDEYLHKVKLELLKLFTYTVCQKPDGTYSCEQSIHKNCYTLVNFFFNLQKATEIASFSFGQDINDLIIETINTSSSQFQENNNSKKTDIDSLNIGMNIINENIDILNKRIDSFVLSEQKKILEHRNLQAQAMNSENQRNLTEINSLNQEVKDLVDDYNSNLAKARYLAQKIESAIEEYNSYVDEIESNKIKYTFKQEEFNSRVNSYNLRLQNYKDNIQPHITKIESGLVNASEEVIQSINNEINYLDRESEIIEEKERILLLDREKIEEMSSYLKIEQISLEREIKNRNNKYEELQSIEENLAEKAKIRNKHIRYYDDKVKLEKSLIEYFDKEFDNIKTEIANEIREMNQKLEEIYKNVADFNAQNKTIDTDFIFSAQKKINICIDEMKELFEKFYLINETINKCVIKFDINKLVSKVILDCNNYHFDETNEYAYKGSTYNQYKKSGLVLMLLLTNLLVSKSETISNNELLHKNILNQVELLNIFPDNNTTISESEIFFKLEPHINKLFSPVVEKNIKKVAF